MKKMQQIASFASLGLLFFVLTGCSSPPDVNYYTLSVPTNTAIATNTTVAVPVLAFTLAPVAVPERLMRPHLVWQHSATADTNTTKLEIDDFNRWASSFDNEIRDALRSHISQQIPALDFSQNSDFLTPNTALPLLQVSVQLNQLETIENSHIRANFGWTIKSYNNKKGIFCQWNYAKSIAAGIPNLIQTMQIMTTAAAQNLANDMQQFQAGKAKLLSRCKAQ